MIYARINLELTNYTNQLNWAYVNGVETHKLKSIYYTYCRYKKFSSVMPMFDSEFFDHKNDLIGYFDNDQLVAWSLMRRYDNENVEAVQFAWNYENPKLRLGIASLKNECWLYKDRGFKYLYLGGADEYKQQIDGFEILGPA